jgi:hypothetical protein
MTGRDRIAITGAHGFGISAALIASLSAHGVVVVNLEDEPEQMTLRRDATLDRLEMLEMLVGAKPRSGAPNTYEPGPPTRRQIKFVDTPKPLSKRRTRRLRGRAAA